MYHMGVIKALIENGAMPGIISGTSGGAIVAGVRGIHTSNPNPNPRCSAPYPNSLTPTLAPGARHPHPDPRPNPNPNPNPKVLGIHTDEEMLNDVIADDIAVRYPERWFPPIAQQLYSYLKHGCLVEHDSFAACCRAYYGDWTFGEAHRKTGRVININISVRGAGGSKRGAVLLNHMTTPSCLIRSAVHASCALPTVMHSTRLLYKASSGEVATPTPDPSPSPSPSSNPTLTLISNPTPNPYP